MTDTIRLTGLRATGYHGVFEHERRNGQEFVVDADGNARGRPVGVVVDKRPVGEAMVVGFSFPPSLAAYIAEKGSITINGVSLTVNDVTDQADGITHFAVNIIPHTAEVTTLGTLAQGDAVNLEIDVLARYLQRMQSLRG